ncbi:hypothetical protein [Angustibacter peucedani]
MSEDVGADLAREAARVVDRLRSTALDRLDGELEQRVHETSQALADLAAGAAGRGRRPVPVLASHGVADQLAVCAHDVQVEGDEVARREALALLVTLRRTL